MKLPLPMLCAICCALAAMPAGAFKLQAFGSGMEPAPAGTDRQMLAFMRQFSLDVHERITRLAYDKAGVKLPEDVIAGVRWNDNPPALKAGALFGGCGSGKGAAEEMKCFTGMFRVDRMAIEVLEQREKTLAPVRSHFGDMQFLHAMAGRAGEPPEETRRNALRWSEFAYRVARGEIGPRVKVYGLKRSGAPLEETTAEWLAALFSGSSKREWTVTDLSLPVGRNVRLMAFGSLLHLVEDSYSASHVRRASARVQANGCPSYDAADAIVAFHTYVGQDTEKHGVCDDAPDWLEVPRAGSPVDVLAEIVRAYDEGREWAEVRAILEARVFRLADSPASAEPGKCFEWRFTAAVANASTEPVVAVDCR